MEVMMHYMYVVAIKDATTSTGIRAWAGDTPFELMMVGFFNLFVIWFKV